MKIKNRFCASYKPVFRIDSLNRLVFADNKSQCESKFEGHFVEQVSEIRKFVFVIFGI
jgi:hypothetical protein